MKVVSIFGTRPEAIKMAPVVMELEKREGVESIICVTAQHRQMLDQVLEVFKIIPDFDLNIMSDNQTLDKISVNVLVGIGRILDDVKPDIILVHGDTTTAMAASIAAFYRGIKIGHVEAGLRTYDISSPFPEEFNRQVIDCAADYLFAPTKNSALNLKKHNKNQKVFITGNTAIDALKYTIDDGYTNPVLDWVGNSRLILLTAHRRENLGLAIENICKATLRIVNDNKDVKVIFPVHKNPKVRKTVRNYLSNNDQIKLIEPLDVLDFHNFMKKAYIIMSDSGGVQEEAPSLGKPVVVLRNTTERPEGIEAGTLKLAGVSEDNIYNVVTELLNDKNKYEKMARASNPYGDGNASKRIVDIVTGS